MRYFLYKNYVLDFLFILLKNMKYSMIIKHKYLMLFLIYLNNKYLEFLSISYNISLSINYIIFNCVS
jgi:hypothetical protein